MSNLESWNKVCRPPASALKAIAAGRLKGKTDINPQWRLKIMTEVYGQCGIGWYYDVVRFWCEEGADSVLMAFAHIHLFILNGDKWSAPIPGVGGSQLVQKESSGLHSNDEAYKMATTDALSVAMKQLGVASDIYEGLWDGSKYKEIPKQMGVHKPADNPSYKPSGDELIFIESVYDTVISNKDDPERASVYLYEGAKLDADQFVWVWNKLAATKIQWTGKEYTLRGVIKGLHENRKTAALKAIEDAKPLGERE